MLLHSGTLVASRPLRPLLDVLANERYRGRFRLVLHGYLSPASRAELVAAEPTDVEVLPPSTWEEAVVRMRRADACVVTQSTLAGDQTAIASKVFEYLALGKPVLSLTDGGATEALLRRVGADELLARLDDSSSIAAALDRLLLDEDWPAPVPPAALAAYDYRSLARRMANLLDVVAEEEH
jgi:glycosyltransferase involved in cell wall biosynthesis